MSESLCQKRTLEAFQLDPVKWGGNEELLSHLRNIFDCCSESCLCYFVIRQSGSLVAAKTIPFTGGKYFLNILLLKSLIHIPSCCKMMFLLMFF